VASKMILPLFSFEEELEMLSEPEESRLSFSDFLLSFCDAKLAFKGGSKNCFFE
jgi:hypothetical protein